MTILGINGGFGGGYQDACACLYADGIIQAAVEEERLIKIKFAPGTLPLKAIREVLELSGKNIDEVDLVAFHGISWPEKIESDLRSFFLHHFGHCPPIRRFHHHDAHAASTYYLSGFDEALVITADNSGDGISSQVMTAKNGKLTRLQQWEKPNSFGTFYSCMTQLCGFERDAGEYKLMGLAPYGNPDRFDLDGLLSYRGAGEYILDQKYLYPIIPGQAFPNKQIPLYSDLLLRHLDLPGSGCITDNELRNDLAAAAQHQLEKVFSQWVQYWVEHTGIKNVCLAGGVAMNCVLNRQLYETGGIDNLFIPPFAGDQGVSIGNAFLAGAEKGIYPAIQKFSPYTGRSFTSKQIAASLEHNRIPYKITDHVAGTAADYIASGKIIGWFQGSAEIGPRALGNRSILANPAIRDMKDRINQAVKFRESFRPFCPAVLQEDMDQYFKSGISRIPFMNITTACREITIRELPAIVHTDQTARTQTVSQENNAIFHELLQNLKKLTGHGVVLNTSLNVRNQPMAYDIQDALSAFYSSGLDALFLENILIEK